MTLENTTVGKVVKIKTIGGAGALRRRLLDMGLTPKTLISVIKVAPMGDPLVLSLRNYELTLRKEDAARIEVEDIILWKL